MWLAAATRAASPCPLVQHLPAATLSMLAVRPPLQGSGRRPTRFRLASRPATSAGAPRSVPWTEATRGRCMPRISWPPDGHPDGSRAGWTFRSSRHHDHGDQLLPPSRRPGDPVRQLGCSRRTARRWSSAGSPFNRAVRQTARWRTIRPRCVDRVEYERAVSRRYMSHPVRMRLRRGRDDPRRPGRDVFSSSHALRGFDPTVSMSVDLSGAAAPFGSRAGDVLGK